MKIDTKYEEYKNKNYKEALIFNDSICPHCGDNLNIFYKSIKDYIIPIKYYCQCGFECPLGHNCEDNDNPIYPIYDGKIKEFIKSFGESNIINRRDLSQF